MAWFATIVIRMDENLDVDKAGEIAVLASEAIHDIPGVLEAWSDNLELVEGE